MHLPLLDGPCQTGVQDMSPRLLAGEGVKRWPSMSTRGIRNKELSKAGSGGDKLGLFAVGSPCWCFCSPEPSHMEEPEQAPLSIAGLVNFGNTCFANALLQVG